jgi:hypothetical protein
VLAHPRELDPAVAGDVVVDLGAALGVDAVTEGDVAAEQLALAVAVGPGPLGPKRELVSGLSFGRQRAPAPVTF